MFSVDVIRPNQNITRFFKAHLNKTMKPTKMQLLAFPFKTVLWSKKENNQHTCIVKAIVF